MFHGLFSHDHITGAIIAVAVIVLVNYVSTLQSLTGGKAS